MISAFHLLHQIKGLTPTICTSLSDAWSLMKPHPVGILDQLNIPTEPSVKLTASIYLPQQSRLVVGRQDGSIIIVPATQTVMLQLLHVQNVNYTGKTIDCCLSRHDHTLKLFTNFLKIGQRIKYCQRIVAVSIVCFAHL